MAPTARKLFDLVKAPMARNQFDLLDVDDGEDTSKLMSHHMKLAEKKAAEDKIAAEAVKREKLFEQKVKDSVLKRAEVAKLRIYARNYEYDCDRLYNEVVKLDLKEGSEEYQRRLVSINEKNEAAKKERVNANKLEKEAGRLENDVAGQDEEDKAKVESLAKLSYEAAIKSMRDEVSRLKNSNGKLRKEIDKLMREIEVLPKGSDKRKQKEASMDEKHYCALANNNLAKMLYREAEDMESRKPKVAEAVTEGKTEAVPLIPERPNSAAAAVKEEDKTISYADYLKRNAKKGGKEETKKVVKKQEQEEVKKVGATRKANKVNVIKELAKIGVQPIYEPPVRTQYKKPVAPTGTVVPPGSSGQNNHPAPAPAIEKKVETPDAPVAAATAAPLWSRKLFRGAAPPQTPASERKVVQQVKLSLEKDFPSLK